MSETKNQADGSLVGLVQAGQLDALGSRWQAEVTAAAEPRPDALAALDACIKVGQAALAEVMAFQWVEAQKNRVGNASDAGALKPLLAICRELLLRVDNAELRKAADALYRKVYADFSHMEAVLAASGLNPAPDQKKTHPRKAVRVLEGMFGLSIGTYLARRGEDRMGQVTEIDSATATVTVRLQKGTEKLTPSDVADLWEAAHPEDFRVLEQLKPAHVSELAKKDPVALVTAIVRARGNKADSNQIKKALVPKHVPAAEYDGWWTKARAALRRDPFLRVEGRTPVVVTYDPAGRSHGQEVAAAFEAAKAKGVDARYDIIAAYIRESARRKEEPDRDLVRKMQGTLVDELAGRLAKSPNDLDAAVMLDKLEEETGAANPAGYAARILKAASDPMPLFRKLDDSHWLRALVTAQKVWPDTWVETFVKLLPTTPPSVCDAITARLLEAGKADRVNKVISEVFNKPNIANLPGLLWLWKGPSAADKLNVPSKVNLFTKVLNVLDALGAKEGKTDDETRNGKAAIKSALSARNHESFRAALEGADLGLAAVVRRQVERCDALGPSLRDDLVGILREGFKELFKVAKALPWEDPTVIWSAEAGVAKKKAELDELVNVKMPANARAIAAAREHGDLRENADYQAAREEQVLLNARQAEIQRDLNMVRVLTPEIIPTDSVGIGSKVTLVNTADNATHQVTLLGPWDADRERNIYPYKVAMYKPLLGLKRGDEVELSLLGKHGNYRIEKIERGIEDSAGASKL